MLYHYVASFPWLEFMTSVVCVVAQKVGRGMLTIFISPYITAKMTLLL